MQQLQAAASQAATEAIAEAAQELAQRLPVPASGGPAPSPLPSNASVETVPIPCDPRDPRESFHIGTREEVLATVGDAEPIGMQENMPATGGDGDDEPVSILTTPQTVQGPQLQAAAATPPHTALVQEDAVSPCGSFMWLGTQDVMQKQPGGTGSSAPAASSGRDSFIGVPPGLGGDVAGASSGRAGSSAPPHPPWPMNDKPFLLPASGGK